MGSCIKTYEEGWRNGFREGQVEANKIIEQMIHTSCNPIAVSMPKTEAVKLLRDEEELNKAKLIIKKLSWDIRNRSYNPVKDLDEAEDFLKEVENDS